MMTENLQEMVSGMSEGPIKGMISEYDILLGRTAKKEELSAIAKAEEESSPVQELQVMKKSEPFIPEIQSKATIKIPEVELVNEYHPKSEQALIDYVNSQNSKLEMANILVKWEIGRCINSFYQGKYGTNELGKISDATGIGRDTLAKACKFAKQYSKEHMEMLLKGNFVMSWTQIAPHLTIAPQKVIETYQVSPDPKQFYYGIIKLKSPSEVRGKSKPSKIVEVNNTEAPVKIAPEITRVESDVAEYNEPYKKADLNIQAMHEAHRKELEMLKTENERLKKEILSRDVKIKELEKALSDVQREKEQYEDSYHVYMYKLDKVRAGLENNAPVRTILQWLDQGDDE